jgi:hypothetical protein
MANIIDSINQARQMGASDDQILTEIMKQNPEKAKVFEEAFKRGAKATEIIDEIIRQNQSKQTISQPQKEEKSFLRKAAEFIASPVVGFGETLGTAIATPYISKAQQDIDVSRDIFVNRLIDLAKKEEDPEKRKKIIEVARKANEERIDIMSQIPAYQKSGREVVGEAIGTAAYVLPGAGKSLAAKSAFTGGLFGASGGLRATERGENLEESQETIGKTILKTGISTGVGAGVGWLIGKGTEVLSNFLKDKLPVWLSRVSRVPEESLQYQAERPKEVGQALKNILKEEKGAKTLTEKLTQKSGQKALAQAQESVKLLRKQLTQEWQSAVDSIIEKQTEKRVGLTDRESQLIGKYLNKYLVEGAPKNLKNLSFKEMIDIYTKLNDLYSKPALQRSPEGVPIASLLKSLKTKMINNFGEDVGNLLSNYSNQKAAYDALDTILKAYRDKDVKAQQMAYNTLKNIFNENKEIYLKTLLEFAEKNKDIFNVLDVFSALTTKSNVPERIGELGAGEILRTIGARLFRLPFTPYRAGQWARAAGIEAWKNESLRKFLLGLMLNYVFEK